jgi:amino acid transporter
VAGLTAHTIGAAAPLITAAALIPLAYAHTGPPGPFGGLGLPLAFAAVGALLVLFSIGYLGRRHRTGDRGPLYVDVARALGRPLGVAAAWLTMVAGNAGLIGLYGLIGAVLAPWAARAGLGLPWWCLAAAACVVVGMARVLVAARPAWTGPLSAALVAAQVTVLVGLDVTLLLHPAGGAPAGRPGALAVPGVLVVALVAFLGFDAAVGQTVRARHGDRTVAVATYLSLAAITGLASLSAWAIRVAAGVDATADFARVHGADTMFVLAAGPLGPALADVGRAVFALTVLTAAVRLQAALARQGYVLGRERGLPALFGRTTRSGGSPAAASCAQVGAAAAVLALAAVLRLDPVRGLYFWLSTAGAFGTLLVLVATALAVAVSAARPTVAAAVSAGGPPGPRWWHRWVAPGLALVSLSAMMTGAGPGWLHIGHLGLVPAVYAGVALLGIGWALRLRLVAPADYHGLVGAELWPVPPLRGPVGPAGCSTTTASRTPAG